MYCQQIKAKLAVMRVACKAGNLILVGILQEEIKFLKEMGKK